MNIRLISSAFLICLLAGCKSIDGTYYPGCIAYEGSKITLRDGQFVWDKFTDQVLLDEDGNVVNPFPGFPKKGSYRIDGHVVQLTFESDGAAESLHLHRRHGDILVLTDAENTAWEATGQYQACVLTRESENGA